MRLVEVVNGDKLLTKVDWDLDLNVYIDKVHFAVAQKGLHLHAKVENTARLGLVTWAFTFLFVEGSFEKIWIGGDPQLRSDRIVIDDVNNELIGRFRIIVVGSKMSICRPANDFSSAVTICVVGYDNLKCCRNGESRVQITKIVVEIHDNIGTAIDQSGLAIIK